MYRVRKQAITGKLILQTDIYGPWRDAAGILAEFVLVEKAELADLRARVAKYEKRAKGQRDAIARRAAAQQPATQEQQQ